MAEKTEVGRVALRVEGEWWNGYWAPRQDSMDGAVHLGSVRMGLAQNPKVKQAFIDARYATLAGVLDEVRPKLAAQGISVLQMPVNGDGSNVGIVTRLLHSSGQWIESALYVVPTKFDAQGVGSALTYLRRYSLMAMAGVGPEDDDGNAAVGKPQARPQTVGTTRADAAPPAPERPALVNRTAAAPRPEHDSDDPFRDDAAPTSAPLPPPSPEEPPEIAERRRAATVHFWTRNDYSLDPAVIQGGIGRWDAEMLALAEAAPNLDALLKLKDDNKAGGFVKSWEGQVATPVIKRFRERVLAAEKRLEAMAA